MLFAGYVAERKAGKSDQQFTKDALKNEYLPLWRLKLAP